MRQPERWHRQWTRLDWDVAYLMESSEPLSAREVAERVGCTIGAVKIIRKRLVREGYFRVVDPGGGRGRPPIYEAVD